jgi:type VI secretion system FHA domain protein
MPVTVKIFTKHGGRPSLFQTREFDALPVTLGRDATCTVALEDPNKHISRVHVELVEENGAYWLSVVSKVNPVMVKGKRHGPGTRLPLQSGDSFDMGEFEVQVVFPEKARPAPPPPGQKKSLIQMLAQDDEDAAPQNIPPPEPGIFDEPTYVGHEEPTYMGPAIKAPPAPAPEEPTYIGPAVTAPPPPPAPEEKKPVSSTEVTEPPRPAPAPAAPAASAGSMNEALRIFLEGAGLPHKDLTPAQCEALLKQSGAILRAAVEGLMMLLIARSEMRKEFEAEERTMVAARDNNPLKLMADPQEAMEFLFDSGQRAGGFLEPVPAIADAAEDLRAHELALMAGMRSAIMGAVRRFDPQALEKIFEKSASGFSLGSRKAKLWEVFVAHQQRLAQEGQEDFNKVFGRDFMSAYQAQIRRLKSGR